MSGAAETLWPIIRLLQDLAAPVAMVCMILGFIQIITGDQRQGLQRIKWATVGYVGIQWVPWLMSVVREVGRNVAP